MQLKPADSCTHALLTVTSMGTRLTPLDRQPVHSSQLFRMQVTSAETNACSIVSYLGKKVRVLSALVSGSPIARMISDNLAARHMDLDAVIRDPGGPWGLRHQINIADAGAGARGPRVYNDRAGEAGRTLGPDDFDLDAIFARDGVQAVHLSGLFAAQSQSTGALCNAVARAAKANGSLVSFDLNYRASFWSGRDEELRSLFREIAAAADVLVGNEEDFQLALGLPGPGAGGSGLQAKTDAFRQMIERAGQAFPDVSVFATTLREVRSAGEHLWGAILSWGGEWLQVEPKPIGVHDRIGGGDGFVGGLLYGILSGWSPRDCLHFGWASGALAVTFDTDYAQPADEEQIWSIWQGDARVKR